ncbi:hypothetical protein OG21DRAFT_1491171 [Imleria badia]|nr:hypothetical protein OG21DRAFT_1491171 [Imleria badia]
MFMIVIEEQPKWDFMSGIGDDLGSVVKNNFAWISIRQVSFELYLCSPSGSLVIGDASQDEYSACGTLYPTIDMLDIDLLLLNASNTLRDSLVLEMQGTNTSAESIERVHQSTAGLIIPWDHVLVSYKMAVLAAAYQHYKEWYSSIYHHELFFLLQEAEES